MERDGERIVDCLVVVVELWLLRDERGKGRGKAK
jgi:hypothetical protein